MKLATYWIPGGDLGTHLTLMRMAGLVRAAARDPLTQATAASIVRAAPLDGGRQVEVIAAWLREHTAFVADPEGPSDSIELLRDPVLQLRRIAQTYTAEGDCDDAAMLAAALGCAAGFPVRFRVVGFTPDPRGPVVHVFTELYHAPAWRPLDVTRPVDPTERFPVPVTRTWVYYV